MPERRGICREMVRARRPTEDGAAGPRSWLGSARLGSARLGSARLGSARLGSARLGSARLGSARLGSARLGSARLGSARLGSARLGSARLGSARLGSARLGSARLGSARLGSARLGQIMEGASFENVKRFSPFGTLPTPHDRKEWAVAVIPAESFMLSPESVGSHSVVRNAHGQPTYACPFKAATLDVPSLPPRRAALPSASTPPRSRSYRVPDCSCPSRIHFRREYGRKGAVAFRS